MTSHPRAADEHHLDRHRAHTKQTSAEQTRAEQLARWHTDDHTSDSGDQWGFGSEPPTAADQSW